MKNSLIITLILVFAILFSNMSPGVYGENFKKNKSDVILSKYIGKDANEIYQIKTNESKEALLKEFKEIEESINLDRDMTVLIPFAVALMEKKDSFTNDEILSIIKDEDVGAGLESTLIQMYSRKNGNKNELEKLLKDNKIDINTKKLIIGTNSFSAKELKNFFKENDNVLAISAIKKLMVNDLELNSEIVKEVLLSSQKVTDEKLIASYIGIGEYYNKKKSDNVKNIIVEKMKNEFKRNNNEMVKDNIIYSLAKMNDLNILKYIINSKDIDKELKVSAIERNLVLLIETIQNDISEENLDFVLDVMQVHPITDINNDLKKLTTNYQFSNNKKLLDTISYIEKNGIKGVFKYE